MKVRRERVTFADALSSSLTANRRIQSCISLVQGHGKEKWSRCGTIVKQSGHDYSVMLLISPGSIIKIDTYESRTPFVYEGILIK